MTKTQKTVSNLMAQLSNQILIADEIDKTQTFKLCNLTSRILRESARKKSQSKSITILAGFAVPFFTDKKKFKKLARAYKYKENHLEKSLDKATQIIQTTNAKKLFKIIEMNMKSDLEKTIEYIMKSLDQTGRIEINGMTLLVGEARKVHNGKCREIY